MSGLEKTPASTKFDEILQIPPYTGSVTPAPSKPTNVAFKRDIPPGRIRVPEGRMKRRLNALDLAGWSGTEPAVKSSDHPEPDLSETPKPVNQKALNAQEHMQAQRAIDDNKKLAILAQSAASESVEHVQQIAKLMRLINRAIHDAL